MLSHAFVVTGWFCLTTEVPRSLSRERGGRGGGRGGSAAPTGGKSTRGAS